MPISIGTSISRETAKLALRPFLGWGDSPEPEQAIPGYSIVVGVPWLIRHLLPVNLHFVNLLELDNLVDIHLVFDRAPRDGAETLISELRTTYPHLPLRFHFFDRALGRIVEPINSAGFYCATAWCTGLRESRSTHVVLHDFDMYPLVPDYFERIYLTAVRQNLRFCGIDFLTYDGITEQDRIVCTWSLGIDRQWLKQTHRLIDCYHGSRIHDGQLIHADPFTNLQLKTPPRDIVESWDRKPRSHVSNLCSTVLELVKDSKRVHVGWRLPYLWYLESVHLSDQELAENADGLVRQMRSSRNGQLTIGPYSGDYSNVHASGSNSLKEEIEVMEIAVHSRVRPQIESVLTEFENFLLTHGDSSPIYADGELVWSPAR